MYVLIPKCTGWKNKAKSNTPNEIYLQNMSNNYCFANLRGFTDYKRKCGKMMFYIVNYFKMDGPEYILDIGWQIVWE